MQRIAVLHLEERCERAIEWALNIEPSIKHLVNWTAFVKSILPSPVNFNTSSGGQHSSFNVSCRWSLEVLHLICMLGPDLIRLSRKTTCNLCALLPAFVLTMVSHFSMAVRSLWIRVYHL